MTNHTTELNPSHPTSTITSRECPPFFLRHPVFSHGLIYCTFLQRSQNTNKTHTTYAQSISLQLYRHIITRTLERNHATLLCLFSRLWRMKTTWSLRYNRTWRRTVWQTGETCVTSIFCEHSYAISSYLTNPARSNYTVVTVSLTTLCSWKQLYERMYERKNTNKKTVTDNVTTT